MCRATIRLPIPESNVRITRPNNSNNKRQDNPNHDRSVLLINVIILSFITLAAVAVTMFFYLMLRRSEATLQTYTNRLNGENGTEKSLYTQEELDEAIASAQYAGENDGAKSIKQQIMAQLGSGNTTLSMLRDLFPEDIVVGNNGRYYFYPVQNTLGLNDYAEGDFAINQDGLLLYQGTDAGVQLEQGIHVTADLGRIDWEDVAADHVDYVMIYVGGRDADGEFQEDKRWEENLEGAHDAGLKVGVYYSLSIVSEEEAQEDADHLVELLEPYDEIIDSYAAISIRIPEDGDRTEGVTRATRTGSLQLICDTLQLAGYQPMIYESLTSMMLLTETEQLTDVARWIANDGATLYFPYTFTMWRYTMEGSVNGIDGNVPRDVLITKSN